MTDDDESDDEPLVVECDIHGPRPSAVICGHLIHPTKTTLGFVENSSDPNDLQAWCDACERMFVREQELTEAFRKFNDMAVVCDGCYARIKKQHSAPSKKKYRRWRR